MWSYDVNKAPDVLIPKILARPQPSPSRGLSCGRGQADRSTDVRHHFSSPIKCRCNTQSRGSARPSALRKQVTLTASILRSHLQDDREPRPTKLLRPTLKLTPLPLGVATPITYRHRSLLHLNYLPLLDRMVHLPAAVRSTLTSKHLHQNREKDRGKQHTEKGNPDHTGKYGCP